MLAIVVTKYGSPEVLQLMEIGKPKPKPDQILIKVHAASVTAADSMMRRADPFIARFFLGFFRPRKAVLGTGFAGKIEAIGGDVTNFKIGDRVFGETGLDFGANAEYICMPADGVVANMPANMSFEDAAPACDGAITSLNFLKDLAHVQKGQKVLIIGASGSLGTAAVQLARHFGAQVTGVCSSTNVAMIKALGADRVIDYTKEDFTKSGQSYDVIYDTVGKSSFTKAKHALTPIGAYLSPVLKVSLLFQMAWTSKFGTRKAMFSATGLRSVPDLLGLLAELKQLYESGKLKSVIDRRYPLAQAVRAHAYVDSGRKKGNVVFSLA